MRLLLARHYVILNVVSVRSISIVSRMWRGRPPPGGGLPSREWFEGLSRPARLVGRKFAFLVRGRLVVVWCITLSS